MSCEVYVCNLNQPGLPKIRARYCDSFLCRLRGLTFRRSLPQGEGLLLVETKDSLMDSTIHMLFMWMDLVVVWIDSSLSVVDVKLARRWRLAYFPQKPARYILELPFESAGSFSIGDLVAFEKLEHS